MIAAVLFIAALLVACSSQDQPVGHDGPDGEHVHADAKHVQSYNPYEGLTQGRVLGNYGTPEDAAALLKVLAERIAVLMTDTALRRELAECLNVEADREDNLAEMLLSHPNLLKALAADFKQAIGDFNGDLASNALNESNSDEDALLTVSQGLMGVPSARQALQRPEGRVGWRADTGVLQPDGRREEYRVG